MLAEMSPDEILKAVREEFEKNNALFAPNHTSKDKDIVVFIGNTGAGKSTLINFLAGKALQVVGQRYALVNSGDPAAMPIGSRMFNSETLYPKSIDIETGENGTLRFFDLPGLNDTDGSVRNLVNASFVRQILLDARTIRFVYVAGQDQFTADRGQSVQQTVKALSNLFVTASTPSRPLDSGLLVVNKEDGLIEDLRNASDVNIPEQIKIWKDQGRIAGMYHTRLSEQNNEAHQKELVRRIASLEPQKLISVNVSSLYPSNTRKDIERMYEKVYAEAYQKVEGDRGISLTEMNKTKEMWKRDTFWDEFETMYVYGQNPGIEVLKELTLGSYSKVRHKYIEEQEDRRMQHIENLGKLINLKIIELKEGTIARAKDIVKGIITEQSQKGVVPYDFGNQVEYWTQVCGPEVLEGITRDAAEQEVIREAYIGWIGEYFQGQIDRQIENNRLIRELQGRVDALSRRHIEIPEIARGNEAVYQQFLRGKLVYKPNKDNDEGRQEFRISDLENPLSGTFDIRGCGDSDQHLSISTGFRTGKNDANRKKVEVWIVPQFVLQKDARAKAFNDFLQKQEAHRNKPFAILFNWGGWTDIGWHDVTGVVGNEFDTLANAAYASGRGGGCGAVSITSFFGYPSIKGSTATFFTTMSE
jgi:energy-coupling factor transporter ATP-binding protein EcfA2